MKKLLTIMSALLVTAGANAQTFNGYALYANQNQSSGYLIDNQGDIAKTWNLPSAANYACALHDNGNFVYGAVNSGNSLNGAAVGGKVVSINASNSIVWQYVYSNSQHVSHHDICLMPNGNVLLIAWEVKTSAQLTQHGYANATTSKWPDHIIEVQQNGTGGQIVWEWHMWDHMVQDYNSAKDNYGVVANHPELLDVNVPVTSTGGGPGGGGGDWFHTNGIDYNPELDQIVFSSRYLSEIFVIDHSTTTAEAAGHTGGNAGKGGDFLYRWGHPSNYDAPGTQVIPAATHDARWVKAGRPNAGYIQIFNNEGGTGGHSAVDAINPPLSGYNYTLTAGQAYSPSTYTLRHNCLEDADGQSSSDRMSNGNVFVNVADQYMYEVDAQDNVVWQYAAGPKKAFRYECDYPGIAALLGADPCGLVGIDEAEAESIAIYPNPSNGIFNISGIPTDESIASITVVDMLGSNVLTSSNTNLIDLSNASNGFYFISINFESGDRITRKVSVIH
ncbi:MAG: aryl-sulfate sulfotransferase [Flavobacteriales bacterium]|nr:aryl-sulfate sulfotransferase [Flavobacteriales bacterium]